MKTAERVLLATSATLAGSSARDTRDLIRGGWSALRGHLEHLPRDRRETADAITEDLLARDIGVTLLGDADYPARLLDLRSPPSFLFWWGNYDLLERRGVGMCGSRDASERGLGYARLFGQAVVQRGLQVISGYARGVDTETHLGALEAGGATVIVLAEGITHFRKKRVFRSTPFDGCNVLALSQFPPSQPWTAGAAMTRNGVIAALSHALLVIEARERGGTLNAGMQAYSSAVPCSQSTSPRIYLKGTASCLTKARVACGRGLSFLRPSIRSLPIKTLNSCP